MRDGVSERCVVATLADLAVANELAAAVLTPRRQRAVAADPPAVGVPDRVRDRAE